MKRELNKYIFSSLLITSLFFTACNKDEDSRAVNTAPESFSLIGIPNSTIGVSQEPTLSWEAATDIDNDQVFYDVYLEDFSSSTVLIVPGDPPQNPTKIIAQGISDTSITLDKLPLSARINWKVIARDNKGGATESEVFKFRTRHIKIREDAINASAAFNARYGHNVVFFNDKFWLIGGSLDIENQKNDVWSSSDGKEWVLENVDTGFNRRLYASVTVFKNKIWLIGGHELGGAVSDIWTSEDGINWIQESIAAPFGNRVASKLIVYNDTLFLIGGLEGIFTVGDISDEVWSSKDGKDWILETMDAPYNAQFGFEAVVFNDQIFVIGGAEEGQIYHNEVWSSRNGKDWTKSSDFNKFSKRAFFNVTVFDNKIWLAGGSREDLSGQEEYNDLWYSLDGTKWQRQTQNAFYDHRFGSAMVSGNNRILLVAGNETLGDALNDVWMFN